MLQVTENYYPLPEVLLRFLMLQSGLIPGTVDSIFQLFDQLILVFVVDMLAFLNFRWLLEFIYKVAKFSGFVFMSIDFKSFQIIPSKWNFVAFALSLGLSFLANFFDAYLNIALVTRSELMEMGVNIIVRVFIYVACILKVSNALQSKKFFRIIKNLQWCDTKVDRLEVLIRSFNSFTPFQFKTIGITSMGKSQIFRALFIIFYYNFIFLIVSFGILTIFAKIGLSDSLSSRNKILFFSTVFTYVQLSSTFLMFEACVFCQFICLNNILRKGIEDPTRKPLISLRETSRIYDNICDIFDDLSEFYLPLCIIFLVGLLYYMTFFIYALYIYYENSSKSLAYFLASAILWIFYFSPTVGISMRTSSWVRTEAGKTIDYIQKLANRQSDQKVVKDSYIVNLLAAHRKPRITIGLFELTWKSLFTVITLIYSFAIILIQFYDVSNIEHN